MEHVDLINYLIRENGYRSYLEIGVGDPSLCFSRIECEHKESCDPYDKMSEADFNGKDIDTLASEVTYRMGSDEMFEQMSDDKSYDIIFVDGYHNEDFSKRDIINSLKHLNDNGVVVVHDCLPTEEKYTGDYGTTVTWYGNVYKSVMDLGKIGAKYVTIREHEFNGCAVIPCQKLTERQEEEYLNKSTFTFSDYKDNIFSRMHLLDISDYQRKVAIYHNSEYLKNNGARTEDGKLAFGATESWVYGISEEISKWCFRVTVFTDVFPESIHFADYRERESFDLESCFDILIMTTDIEKSMNVRYEKFIAIPTCEFFNTDFIGTVTMDKMGMLSDWQEQWFSHAYSAPKDLMFRHFLPCRYDLYKNYKEYGKENSMVWSSAPIRGLRFFIERILPKIRVVFPDFKLYICGYDERYYESEWPKYVSGVEKMIVADRETLSELQKKSKIWIYPNIGRSETSGFFNETYCVTAVENAMAGNAIVCFGGKDGISSTLEGYSGFLDGSKYNEHDENFFLWYEDTAKEIAERAIEILSDDTYRESLAGEARLICEGYTWEREAAIIVKNITE